MTSWHWIHQSRPQKLGFSRFRSSWKGRFLHSKQHLNHPKGPHFAWTTLTLLMIVHQPSFDYLCGICGYLNTNDIPTPATRIQDRYAVLVSSTTFFRCDVSPSTSPCCGCQWQRRRLTSAPPKGGSVYHGWEMKPIFGGEFPKDC